jgi:alcohol dehydrogenase
VKQKEFIGLGSIENVKDIIEEISANNILLVTGKKSYDTFGAKNKLEKILKGVYTEQFDQFEVNPKLEDVYVGIEILSNTKFDLIIAVGGGSVLDMAKLINILAVQIQNDLLQYIDGSKLITECGLPLVAIPTTAGTGSEATHFSVVYVDSIKYSLAHHFMLPNYAIIDTELSYNLPPHIAAASGLDALSQAVESYWAVKSTEESKKYAAAAIKLILPVIEDAVSGNNRAKEIMSKAAHLAGKAINISTTTAPHAISYPITTYFGLQHGHAVSLTLGYFFEINYNFKDIDVIEIRGVDYLKSTMEELFLMFEASSAVECKDKWYSLMGKLGLDNSIRNIGISTEHDVGKITDNINQQRLSNNPVNISENLLRLILSK